jgi:glucuronate isomerase
MSDQLKVRLLGELDSLVLIDPHTHINPHRPASTTLADILGYHYFTELIHSAGMLREEIEQPESSPKELVARLVARIEPLENTVQYSWLLAIARDFFGFEDERITTKNWEPLYDRAAKQMAASDWADQVLKKSRLEAVFLTNDFDDPLEGFDTKRYVPCLRTDDLVFHLPNPNVRQRLEKASGMSAGDPASIGKAIGRLFEHFTARGARACAISLPPDFTPRKVAERDANSAMPQFVFWTLAEYCAEFRLPFDLMIGVNRAVYEGGVYQGRDLFDSRVSLIQYRELFNAFPQVTFPISVLASVTNQELVSYAWIFPNVVTHGHWWYSNTPPFIEQDLAARLTAVPATKQIGYYSDMYKLEFARPKFAMFKRILAAQLAERFVIDRGWSEDRAIDLGRQILRGNVERIFYGRSD